VAIEGAGDQATAEPDGGSGGGNRVGIGGGSDDPQLSLGECTYPITSCPTGVVSTFLEPFLADNRVASTDGDGYCGGLDGTEASVQLLSIGLAERYRITVTAPFDAAVYVLSQCDGEVLAECVDENAGEGAESVEFTPVGPGAVVVVESLSGLCGEFDLEVDAIF
jgi:hypothetical protein